MSAKLEDNIHALLPQTQCQMCGFDDCRAYAKAIANGGAGIELCAPGGEWVLEGLASLCQTSAGPSKHFVQKNYRPPKSMRIRQDECIGCTKCIQACPVDAVIGTGKMRHDILMDICNGCELCLPVCPVDCIDAVSVTESPWQFQMRHQRQGLKRYEKKQQRMNSDIDPIDSSTEVGSAQDRQALRKQEIQRALERARQKTR